jgi:hypothetical protein
MLATQAMARSASSKLFSSVYKRQKVDKEHPFHPWNSIRSYAGYMPFAVASMLAMSSGGLNLAQGFPDYNTLDITQNNLVKVATENFDQVVKDSPIQGNVQFRKNMDELHERRMKTSMDCLLSSPENIELFKKYGISQEELVTHQGLNSANVTVAQGGTGCHGALTSTFLTAGDEVILFEPMFLWYP